MADFKVITPKRDIARELARKYSTMTHDELDVVEDILEPIKYAKGEMILPEGEQCMGISYIEKGLVRQFYFKNGKEVTEHLGVDHTIFMCIESLFKEEPTRLQVEALEPTLVYMLPKKKLEAAAMRTRCTKGLSTPPRIPEAVTRLPAGYCGSEVSVAPRGLTEKPKRQHRTVCADLGAD